MMGRMHRAKSHPLETVWPGGATALTLALILALAGCGGGGSSSSQKPTPPPTPAPNGSLAPAPSPSSMNTARFNATATLLPNSKVLIAGGVNDSTGDLASIELYDSATNSFAPAASLPTMNEARANATATLLPNGKVLIASGGNSTTGLLDSVELYDPAANSFAPTASLPTT